MWVGGNECGGGDECGGGRGMSAVGAECGWRGMSVGGGGE